MVVELDLGLKNVVVELRKGERFLFVVIGIFLIWLFKLI